MSQQSQSGTEGVEDSWRAAGYQFTLRLKEPPVSVKLLKQDRGIFQQEAKVGKGTTLFFLWFLYIWISEVVAHSWRRLSSQLSLPGNALKDLLRSVSLTLFIELTVKMNHHMMSFHLEIYGFPRVLSARTFPNIKHTSYLKVALDRYWNVIPKSQVLSPNS